MTEFVKLDTKNFEQIKELFYAVFTKEPWNDDWSDEEQLRLYIGDMIGNKNSLTYGLMEEGKLVGVSMGEIRHWYSGTEYYINELCILTSVQKKGYGTMFVNKIMEHAKAMGIDHIFLQTERHVPAFEFYKKQGFILLEDHVSFIKELR